VAAVIAAGVAERSIKLERQRREDWRQREQSALTFLADGFPARSFDRIEKTIDPMTPKFSRDASMSEFNRSRPNFALHQNVVMCTTTDSSLNHRRAEHGPPSIPTCPGYFAL
jgi:hypothetical protein